MVKQFGRRRNRRFKCHQVVDDTACQELLRGVWQLDWDYQTPNPGVPPDPYMKHWENCVLSTDDEDLQLEDRGTVISLAGLIKRSLDGEIPDIENAISALYDSASKSTLKLSDQQSELALKFVTKLWFHVSPDLSTLGPSSFREAIKSRLPGRSDPKKIGGRLTSDFCAKHLWRKGGIRVEYTDDIEQHLTFESRTLYVFRNSSMLRALQEDPTSDPFPEGFVKETLRTLYLLFRPLEPKAARRNFRYMDKHLDADLELAMGDYANFDLGEYPYWHKRLSEIQRLYNKKTPSGLVQWWFDRRDRVQWATFWVAFIVFVLTVVFGVIASVTSIWQIWLAYQSKF